MPWRGLCGWMVDSRSRGGPVSGLDGGEGGVDGGEIVLFDGGGGGGAVGAGEGGGDVGEEERNAELVVDADGERGRRGLLRSLLLADELGACVEGGVGGQDRSVGDGDVGGAAWEIEIEAGAQGEENCGRDEDRGEEAAAFGLGEGWSRHEVSG